MKSKERGGVVDKDLNVYGTTSLKVAGLMPPIGFSDSRHVYYSIQCRSKYVQHGSHNWGKGCGDYLE